MTRTLDLMVGLPGQGMHLGIDPLSALFLCMLAPQVVASAIVSEWRSVTFWVLVAGMVLTLLAADGFALILGFALMSAAAWLKRVHPAPSAGVAAVMSGGMVKVALYVIIRYGFVVLGNQVAPWWGAALLFAGAACVLIGGLRAVLEVELKMVLAWATVANTGLIAMGLGLALQARGLDEPMLAELALQGALLGAVAHALFKPLLFLGASAVQSATGTASLDWLGGLMRGMPRLGLLMLLGATGMAALPLSPGFTPQFLLLHAAIAAAGSGGIFSSIGFAALVAVLGLGAALSLAAAVRMIGIGFLGRPRTLRAAAAEEAGRPVLAGMGLLAACCIVVALLPGLLLQAMQPVIAELAPGALPLPLNYAPLPLAVLLLLLAGLAFLLLRRFGAPGEREVPAWNGGFGRPPVWLPFGDPVTQQTATGFAEPVRRSFLPALLDAPDYAPSRKYLLLPLSRLQQVLVRLAERTRRATLRQRLRLVFAALVAALAALGLQG